MESENQSWQDLGQEDDKSLPTEGLIVIGAGLMRTGTATMKFALSELLGAPCYHMYDVMKNFNHCRTWIRALDGFASDDELKVLFDGYIAVMDVPPSLIYKDLMRIYPSAKVILTVRDPDKWAVSVQNTVHYALTTMKSFPVSLFLKLNPGRRSDLPVMLTKVEDRLVGKEYGLGDRKLTAEAFRRWTEEVKSYVPPDRLLVYQVTEGWEPLCEFLGLPIPNTPFPNANDTWEFRSRINKIKCASYTLFIGLPLILAVGGIVFLKKGKLF